MGDRNQDAELQSFETHLHANQVELPLSPISSNMSIASSQEDLQDDSDGTTFSLYPKPYIIGKEVQRNDTACLDKKICCFEDFTVIHRIGEGTYGQVYKAKDYYNKLVVKKVYFD